MYNLTDNQRGIVYILDRFDPQSKSFKKVTPYLTRLRNPNSIAFYKDQNGIDWFYLALTDRLVRYRYEAGKDAPSGEPQGDRGSSDTAFRMWSMACATGSSTSSNTGRQPSASERSDGPM